MTAPVTGLVATANSQEGYVTLAYTNPAGTVTNRIRGFRPKDGAWVVHYQGDAVTTRHVYPTPDQPWNWDVSADDGSGLSVPVESGNVVLPGRGQLQLVVSLQSVNDPAVKLFLGAYDNADNAINWLAQRDEKYVRPGGSQYRHRISSIERTYVADQMDWLLPSYNLEDGSRRTGRQDADTIDAMWADKHKLLYRDFEDRLLYCWMTGPRPRIVGLSMKRASFSLTSIKPPTMPFTSGPPIAHVRNAAETIRTSGVVAH